MVPKILLKNVCSSMSHSVEDSHLVKEIFEEIVELINQECY